MPEQHLTVVLAGDEGQHAGPPVTKNSMGLARTHLTLQESQGGSDNNRLLRWPLRSWDFDGSVI